MKTHTLTVGYDTRVVCDIPDLDLLPGPIWLVTGSNGAGKTTLLKTLAGLLPPVDGSISPAPRPGRGGCVFVHSTPVLFRGSLRHNLHVVDHDGARIERVAAEFRLADRLSQASRELSHGMRQRAAI